MGLFGMRISTLTKTTTSENTQSQCQCKEENTKNPFFLIFPGNRKSNSVAHDVSELEREIADLRAEGFKLRTELLELKMTSTPPPPSPSCVTIVEKETVACRKIEELEAENRRLREEAENRGSSSRFRVDSRRFELQQSKTTTTSSKRFVLGFKREAEETSSSNRNSNTEEDNNKRQRKPEPIESINVNVPTITTPRVPNPPPPRRHHSSSSTNLPGRSLPTPPPPPPLPPSSIGPRKSAHLTPPPLPPGSQNSVPRPPPPPPPLPPSSIGSRKSAHLTPPPLQPGSQNSVPPPPPPPPPLPLSSIGTRKSATLTPPPLPRGSQNSGPPPPPMAKSSGVAATKLMRVADVVDTYRSLTKVVSNGCGVLKEPGSSSGTAAARDLIGEIEKRSSHLQAIKADVEIQGDLVRTLIKEVECAEFVDIEDVFPFVKWLDNELSYLVDERAVLKHFDWPERKVDALREAAFCHSDLKKLELEASSFSDDPTRPCGSTLKIMQGVLEKIENGALNLSRMRETASSKYKSFKIPIDWMVEVGIVSQIKLASLKLVKEYMKRVSKEIGISVDDSYKEELKLQGVRFAFRVHQFAGGFDTKAAKAFCELRDNVRS